MVMRRVLIYDDDRAFLALLQSSLGLYAFEIVPADPGPDSIQNLKVLRPEVAFISADLPDNAGYTLCSAIRKAVGNSIFIVLTTAALSPHDFTLHGKQRLHADLYLDKRDLGSDELLDKLGELIGLGPRIRRLPLAKDQDLKRAAFTENGSELLNAYPPAGPEITAPSELECRGDFDTDAIAKSFKQTAEGKGRPVNPPIPDRPQAMADVSALAYADSENDPDHRHTQQQAEIFKLRRQLEEALRDARSSPFSTDFLKLREIITQKDWEITRITERLHDRGREILTGRNKVKELEREKIELKNEMSSILKKEDKLASLAQEQQREILRLQELQKDLEKIRTAEASRAANLLVLEQQSLQQIREELEARIARLQDQHTLALKEAEQAKKDEIAAAQQQAEQKLGQAEQIRQQALDALKNEFQVIVSAKDAEIAALKQKAAEAQQAFQHSREEFEARILTLHDQHAQAVQEAEQAKQVELAEAQQQAEEKLGQAEQNRQQALEALKNEFQVIVSAKDAEIAALKQKAAEAQHAFQHTREEFEARILTLQDQHAQAVRAADQAKQIELAAAHQQAEEKLGQAEQNRQQSLDALKNEFQMIVSAKDAEIAALKQKAAEAQHAFQHTQEEFEARILTLHDQHAQALREAERTKENEVAAAHQQSEENLTEEHKTLRQTRKELEARLEQLQDQHAQAMQAKQAELAGAHQRAMDRVAEAERNHQQAITALKKESKALLSEKEAGLAALKQKAAAEQQQIRKELEIKIERLQEQNAKIMLKAAQDKRAEMAEAQQQIEQKLAEAEQNHQNSLDSLKNKYSTILSGKEAEIAALKQKGTEEQQQAQQQISHEVESRIAQLQDLHAQAMQQSELQKYKMLESAQKQFEEKMARSHKEHQRAIDSLENKYTQQIDRIRYEKDAEIAKLIKKESEKQQQVNQHTGQEFEAKIARLQSQHLHSLQAEQEKYKALESARRQIEEKLAKTEQKHQSVLDDLKNSYAERIDQILSEKRAEIVTLMQKSAREQQAFQQASQDLDDRIARLQNQHTQSLKVEQEKFKALEAAQKINEEKLAQAEKEHQRVLDGLKNKYNTQIDYLQSEKRDQIAAVRQKAAEETQHALEQIRQQFKDTLTRVQDQQVAALKQAEQEKQKAIEAFQMQFKEKLAKAEKNHQELLKAWEHAKPEPIEQQTSEKTEAIPLQPKKAPERKQHPKFARVQFQPVKGGE